MFLLVWPHLGGGEGFGPHIVMLSESVPEVTPYGAWKMCSATNQTQASCTHAFCVRSMYSSL